VKNKTKGNGKYNLLAPFSIVLNAKLC